MKKTLCLLAILFSTMLSAQESKLTIDHINNWVIYGTDGVQYCMLGWEKKIVGDITYILEFEGKYGYRQESDKVYRYNLADNKEQLVLDYSLQVGDVFPLCEGFSLQVESVSDTTLINEWMEERLCKRIELRGVEQPSYQDVWVESFGSVRYGINPPTEAEDFSHTYLMYATSWDFNFTCNLNLSGAWGMVAPLGEEYPLANEEYLEYDPVEFTLRNDTLHIGGYLRNDCAGPLYMFVEEKADKIFLSTYELPEDADCYSFFKIDVNITGLSKDKYTIIYQGKTFEVPNLYAEHRIYPANSIHCTNGIVINFAEMDYTIPRDTIYYEMWTGNDTIVDGKSCVTLWKQYDRDITTMSPRCKAFTPQLAGVIYEADNGYVYFNYLNGDGSNWKFLYDFSSPNRKEGDIIYYGINDMDEEVYSEIKWVETRTLRNGEEVQVVDGLMYGIGSLDEPFFYPGYMWIYVNAYVPIYKPINFYRNGELLWGTPHDMHSPLAVDENYLAVDGKEWNIVATVTHENIPYNSDVRMWVDGDTLVGDIRYKKLYKQEIPRWEGGEKSLEVGYCRQNGNKYYQNGKLMFDFGLTGQYDTFVVDSQAGLFADVSQIGDTILADGKSRKYQTMCWWKGYEGEGIDLSASDIWVEGIGSLTMGIYDNIFGKPNQSIELQNCIYKGTYLYKKEDTHIAPTQQVEPLTPYYDLQGRPVVNPMRGIYIKDGKKVIIGQ